VHFLFAWPVPVQQRTWPIADSKELLDRSEILRTIVVLRPSSLTYTSRADLVKGFVVSLDDDPAILL
jgi:hypothetical protein